MTSQAATEGAARTGGDRRIIVMMGAPGAGKGTQAERLAAALGLPHVSTGELFRAMLQRDTPLGRKVQRYVDSGALVPDEIVVDMVEERLAEDDAADGAILDGFPRTVAQAKALDNLLARNDTAVSAVPYVEVPSDLLVQRLTGRRVCTKDDQHVYHMTAMPPAHEGICDICGAELYQRHDDTPETVRDRLEKQLPPMFEVIDYYADHRVLLPVRGDQAPADVASEVLRVVAARDTA